MGLAAVLVQAAPQTPAATADWLTDGGDPQRTGWQRHEATISPETAGTLKLLWTRRLPNQPREMHALLPVLVVGRAETVNGARQIVIAAGASDNLFGIDADAGAVLWTRHFDSAAPPAAGDRGRSALCPGGQTATPVIAPGESAGTYVAYALASDGRLRTLDVATGRDLVPPDPFVPAHGKPYALNLVNGVIYTTTAQGCGEHPNAMYAFDLATRRVATFAAAAGGMWGRRGPSIGADGTLFTGTKNDDYGPGRPFYGEAIIAVSRDATTRTLKLRDFYSPPNAEWMARRDLDMSATGPVFVHAGREWIVQSSKECRLWLLAATSLGGADHRTAVDRTPLMCNEAASFESAGVWGAIGTWQDANGMRWILSPFWGAPHPEFHAPIEHGAVTRGAVVAWTMVDQNGVLTLTPRWMSRDMNRAEPPVIANGVVLAYGSGESTTQRWSDPRHADGTEARIAESTHAVLYALDAATGAELWSSADQIRSWNHFSGLSVANGRVYIGTYDGVLYCFGVTSAS